MSYVLNKTNGAVLTTVNDGSIDQTTDLTFVGKNYAGYGEFINEDLLRLLENFANKTQPPKPISGQLWYDSNNKKLKLYDGTNFRPLAQLTASKSSPSVTEVGINDLWFDSENRQLFIRNTDLSFTLIGPSVTKLGSNTTVQPLAVTDQNDNTIIVVATKINGVITSIESNNEDFVPKNDPVNDPSLLAPGRFSKIKKGRTLAFADTKGITSDNGFYFWGTAADSKLLDGRPSSDFALAQDVQSFNGVLPEDTGLLVGVNGVFRFHADSGNNIGKISAVNGTSIEFNLRYPPNSPTTTANILKLYDNKILPGNGVGHVDIGETSNRFGNLFVNTVTSSIISATTGSFTDISGKFKGDIYATNGKPVFNNGSDGTNAIFTGTVQGNLIGVASGVNGVVTSTNITTGGSPGTISGSYSLASGASISGLTNSQYTGRVITTELRSHPSNESTGGTLYGQWTLGPNSSFVVASTNTSISATLPNKLTAGTGIKSSGAVTFDGSEAQTWSVDATTTNDANKIVQRDSNSYIYATRGVFTDIKFAGTQTISTIANSTVSWTSANDSTLPTKLAVKQYTTGTFVPSGTGYQIFPSGLIIQWGGIQITSGNIAFNFPLTFPNNLFRIVGHYSLVGTGVPGGAYANFASMTTAGGTAYGFNYNGALTGAMLVSYIAVGN